MLQQSSGSKVGHKTMEYSLFRFSVEGIITEQEINGTRLTMPLWVFTVSDDYATLRTNAQTTV